MADRASDPSFDRIVLARWEDLQHEARALSVQRGLRFVAAAILAPFGAARVTDSGSGGSGGPRVSALAFGVALLLLALAEVAAIIQAAMQAKARKQMEKRYPALAPPDKPSRFARVLSFLSGPGFSTALYFLLGAAVVIASRR